VVPYVRRLSYLSGVLSEGDKRNSKGDMLGVFLLHTVKEEKEARSRGYFAPEPASRTRPVRGWTDQKVVWELLTLSTEEDPGYNEALGRSRFCFQRSISEGVNHLGLWAGCVSLGTVTLHVVLFPMPGAVGLCCSLSTYHAKGSLRFGNSGRKGRTFRDFPCAWEYVR
jgi:hypothetical protein